MAVRYSAARLEQSSDSKRLCIGLVSHLYKSMEAANKVPTWDHLAKLQDSIPVMEKNIGREWGAKSEKKAEADEFDIDPPELVEEVSDAEDTASSNSSVSSLEEEPEDAAEECDEDEVETADLRSVPWLLPKKGGQMHIRRLSSEARSMEDDTPLCRDAAFVWGYLSGEGTCSAGLLHAEWCVDCLNIYSRVKPALVNVLRQGDEHYN